MEESEKADVECMRLLRKGSPEAFSGIVRRHQLPLVNFFCRLGADRHTAEDCAQETFLRLFRCRERYSPLAPFSAFLYTLARHAWVDRSRRTSREESRAGSTAGAARWGGREDGSDGKAAFSADDRLDLEAALASLPEHLRLVVVLKVYQGLRYLEIARVLEVPTGTVKSRMFHAVRRLREALQAREAR